MADEAPISTINNLFKTNEAARMPQEEGVLAVSPKSIAWGGGTTSYRYSLSGAEGALVTDIYIYIYIYIAGGGRREEERAQR